MHSRVHEFACPRLLSQAMGGHDLDEGEAANVPPLGRSET